MNTLQESSDLKAFGTTQSELEISPSNFGEFKSFLEKIKMYFNDLSIYNGGFRTHTLDNSCVLETGFKYFNDASFTISDLKFFYKSIYTFKNKSVISIKISESDIIFNDSVSELSFRKSNPSTSDNKFISDTELNGTILKSINSERLIIRSAVSKNNAQKMRKIARRLSSNYIHLEHDDMNLRKGLLTISGKSDESVEYQFKIANPLQIPMKKNHYLEFPILPFSFNGDDVYYSCYLINKNSASIIFNTNLKNLYLNIYSQSKFIKKE